MVESHLVRDIGLCGRGGGDLLVRKPIILMLRLYGLRNMRIRLRRAGLGRVGRIMMCRIGRIRMELVRWRKIILMMLILKSRKGRLGLSRVRRIRLCRVGRVMMCRIGRSRMELVMWRKIILMMLKLKTRKGRLGLSRL